MSAAHPCWGSCGQGPPLGAEDTCQFLRHLAGRPAPARSRGGRGTLSAGVKFRTAQPSQHSGVEMPQVVVVGGSPLPSLPWPLTPSSLPPEVCPLLAHGGGDLRALPHPGPGRERAPGVRREAAHHPGTALWSTGKSGHPHSLELPWEAPVYSGKPA